MAKVFISHSWDDSQISRRLAENLKRDGAEVWIDYARISGGDSLPEAIGNGIEWCDTLILIWSKAASNSRYVKLEWNCALSNDKKIIPCLIAKEKLPTILAHLLYIDFSDFDRGYQDLARTLKLSIKISRADSHRETTPISTEPEYLTKPEPREKTEPEFKPKFDKKQMKKPNRYRMISILAFILVSTLGGYIAVKNGWIGKKSVDSQIQSDTLKTNIPVSLPSDPTQKKMADRKSENKSGGDQDISKQPAGQENLKKSTPEKQEVGIIQLTSFVNGEVYIDGQPQGRIASGEMYHYNRPVGNHKIEIKTSSQILTENVLVKKGQIQPITIGTPSTPPQISPEKPAPLRLKFRSTPEELSRDQVIKMLQDKKFYDSSKNESGPGFENQFELRTIAGDKVVVDHASGLMWQQGGSDNYMTFEAAEKWIRDLKSRGYAGYNDWRLPTLEEAMSLMEREKLNGDLYIDPKFDPKQRWIWTSDSYQGASRAAWVVGFTSGICDVNYWDVDDYVRAVRPGQSSSR